MCINLNFFFALQILTKFHLADKYEGQTEVDGEMFEVEDLEKGPGAFRAHLDVGLARTTTGAKVFAVMKGAVDGGIDCPHSEKRFPGFDEESKDFNASVLRDHIMGIHVANYMRQLLDEDEDAYKRQFSRYIKLGITADDMEDMYKNAHQKIREDPVRVKKEKKTYAKPRRFNPKRLTKAQRDRKVTVAKRQWLVRIQKAKAAGKELKA